MQQPSDTVLDAFREALHPAAFDHPFTGTCVQVMPSDRPRGLDGFATWVDEHLARVRDERWPSGGRPERVVLVEDGTGVLRRWDDAPCCQAAWLADRVRPEVAPLTDPWVLGVTLDAPRPSWEGFDPVTGEWEEFGAPRWLDTSGSLQWYAESRRPDLAHVAAGVQHLQVDPADGAELVTVEEPLDRGRSGVARAFRRVLARHPARALHRLR